MGKGEGCREGMKEVCTYEGNKNSTVHTKATMINDLHINSSILAVPGKFTILSSHLSF